MPVYGEPTIRNAVPQLPLAIGLVSASNPHLPILDTLSKYSHGNDLQVATIKRSSKKAPPTPKQHLAGTRDLLSRFLTFSPRTKSPSDHQRSRLLQIWMAGSSCGSCLVSDGGS
jgi:hypothetical protein